MARTAPNLFAEDADDPAPDEGHATGLLPSQHLRSLIEHSREIRSLVPIEAAPLQPASLDLRLGATAWRVRASFPPGEEPRSRTRSTPLPCIASSSVRPAPCSSAAVSISSS
jgi:dCTP deaminase